MAESFRLQKELAEAREARRASDASYIAACARAGQAEKESAEARAFDRLLVDAINLRIAKTSGPSASPAKAESGAGEQASGTTATDGSELPYETAPRLTKGADTCTCGLFAGERLFGDCPVADGRCFPSHRVVRVEPEKAQSKCARCGGEGMLLPLRDGVQCPDCDGGGERSGQVYEAILNRSMADGRKVRDVPSAEASAILSTPNNDRTVDEGPPRVGDVVRNGVVKHEVDAVDGTMLRFVGQAGWVHRDGTVIIHRDGQPEAKAVLPIDAEDERVVDALVHRKTADRAETPLLGPHAATVADHERRLTRLENEYLTWKPHGPVAVAIRAERAGRK